MKSLTITLLLATLLNGSLNGVNNLYDRKELSLIENNLYPNTMVVTDLNYDMDVVECMTFNGDYFCFKGCVDYYVGDLVSCTMYDNCTDWISDDVIIKARYSGYVKSFGVKEDGTPLIVFE